LKPLPEGDPANFVKADGGLKKEWWACRKSERIGIKTEMQKKNEKSFIFFCNNENCY
jgi:hypothetical protein